MAGKPPVLLFEEERVVSLAHIAIVVITAVAVYGINEEKAEYLDPLWSQALLLVEMLPNGPADHFPRYGQRVHVAPGMSTPQELFTPRHAQFDPLVPLLDPDLADAAVTVDHAACRLLQIIAVLHCSLPAPHTSGAIHVKLNLGADHAPFAACREQSHIRLVVGVLNGG